MQQSCCRRALPGRRESRTKRARQRGVHSHRCVGVVASAAARAGGAVALVGLAQRAGRARGGGVGGAPGARQAGDAAQLAGSRLVHARRALLARRHVGVGARHAAGADHGGAAHGRGHVGRGRGPGLEGVGGPLLVVARVAGRARGGARGRGVLALGAGVADGQARDVHVRACAERDNNERGMRGSAKVLFWRSRGRGSVCCSALRADSCAAP